MCRKLKPQDCTFIIGPHWQKKSLDDTNYRLIIGIWMLWCLYNTQRFPCIIARELKSRTLILRRIGEVSSRFERRHHDVGTLPTIIRCWVQCRAGNEGPQSIHNHKEGIVSQQVEGPSRDHLRDCETSNFAKGRCSSSAVTCCLGLTFSHLGPGLKHFACLLSFSCNLRRAARHPAVFRLQRPEAGTRTDELNYTHIMEPSMQGST